MATKRSCKFGKVKSGPRKGACRKRRPARKSKLGGMFTSAFPKFKRKGRKSRR